MVGTIPTYLVYDNVAQCFGHEPLSGQRSSSITGRLRGAISQREQGLRITIGYSGNLGGLYVFVLYSIAGLE